MAIFFRPMPLVFCVFLAGLFAMSTERRARLCFTGLQRLGYVLLIVAFYLRQIF